MLWRSDPDQSRFNMMWDAHAREVVTSTDAPERAWLRGRSVLFAVQSGRERQHFYATGLAAALLSELYAATGEREYLAGAAELLRFDMAVCKWQASKLLSEHPRM